MSAEVGISVGSDQNIFQNDLNKPFHRQQLFPKMLPLVKKYFLMHNVMASEGLPHPPGLLPPDFVLFPLLKTVLKKQQLTSAEGVTATEH
jgi:hypothetical protein